MAINRGIQSPNKSVFLSSFNSAKYLTQVGVPCRFLWIFLVVLEQISGFVQKQIFAYYIQRILTDTGTIYRCLHSYRIISYLYRYFIVEDIFVSEAIPFSIKFRFRNTFIYYICLFLHQLTIIISYLLLQHVLVIGM